jgi:hypothetical protein
MLEEGITYDSSLFPIVRPEYGYPGSPGDPYVIRRPAGSLLELPLTTTRIAGVQFPAAGGAYLRQLPYALIHRAFSEYRARGVPAMFYVHPWEVDADQPRLPVPLISRLRHYRGLNGMLGRLDRLLGDFKFTSVEQALDVRASRRGVSPSTAGVTRVERLTGVAADWDPSYEASGTGLHSISSPGATSSAGSSDTHDLSRGTRRT